MASRCVKATKDDNETFNEEKENLNTKTKYFTMWKYIRRVSRKREWE